MKKQLIVLQGRSDVGKSTSLHFLYKLIVANQGITEQSVKPIWFEAIGRKLDFIATISIEGHLVGIFNRGDVPTEVEQWLQILVDRKCQVIVCAAHAKGAIKEVLARAGKKYELLQVPKQAVLGEPQREMSNRATAHALAAMVYNAISA